jgi:curved DNA-binding protein CbpA
MLDPDAIGSTYRRLAAQLHPDQASGDTLKFRELSEAADMLKDPARRLRELAGRSASSSGGSLPPEAADLFPKVAGGLQQADSLLEKQGAVTNLLAKALLLTLLKKAAENLDDILSLLESWKSTLNQELHRLDQEWAAEGTPSPSTITALALLSDSFTYAGRWELQLRNRKLALEATLG